MTVTVKNGTILPEEQARYIDYIKTANPGREIDSVELYLDGDYVDIDYKLEPAPFQRIRRITGYLVGTLDRFNNAKRSEVEDRVKHNM